MSKGRIATIIGTLLTLSGCEGEPPREPLTNIQAAQVDYQARIAAMPEGARNAVFIRALRDAGRECQGVVSSAYQGTLRGRPTWTARCNDGVGWVIILGNSGIAQVVSLTEAERAGLIKPGSQ